jgi:hypothetical protein
LNASSGVFSGAFFTKQIKLRNFVLFHKSRRYLLSRSRSILTFWKIDAPCLDAQAAANREPPGVAERMDGGREGDAYRDAKDFFLCCQIRSQVRG